MSIFDHQRPGLVLLALAVVIVLVVLVRWDRVR